MKVLTALIAGLLTLSLSGLGMFATSVAASASCGSYTGVCEFPFRLVAKAPKSVAKGSKVKVRTRLIQQAGSYSPRGTLTLRCRNGKARRVQVRTVTREDNNFRIGPLRKVGRWKCVVRFRSDTTKNAGDAFVIRVRRQ